MLREELSGESSNERSTTLRTYGTLAGLTARRGRRKLTGWCSNLEAQRQTLQGTRATPRPNEAIGANGRC